MSHPGSPFDKPDLRRLDWCALDILDEAAAAADKAPIAPGAAVRLALGYLVLRKIAKGWQVAKFWKALTWDFDHQPDTPQLHAVMRGNELRCADNWRTEAGLQPLQIASRRAQAEFAARESTSGKTRPVPPAQPGGRAKRN